MDVDQARRICEFWLGIEHLLPAAPAKADGRERCWTIRSDGELPWKDAGKRRALPVTNATTWRFTAYGGLIDMDGMVADLRRLLNVAAEEEEFRPADPAAVVGINLDIDGMVLGDVFIASLPWAMGRIAAAGGGAIDLTGFDGPDGFEERAKRLVRELLVERQLLADPAFAGAGDGEEDDAECGEADAGGVEGETAAHPRVMLRPLNCADVEAVVDLVLREAGWRPSRPFVEAVRIASFEVSRKNEAEGIDGDMLNSFFASDIARVRDAIVAGDYGLGVSRYLFGIPPERRVEVVKGESRHMLDATMPKRMPPGRWPSRHPLVLAQQAAVNDIIGTLSGGAGIASVNGPPGTGKTTLLRDIVAALVVARARELAKFSKPAAAFPSEIDIRASKARAWRPADQICGFGMVVASANNGAVENVTKELPAAASVDAPGVALDFFAAVADGVLADPNAKKRKLGSSWGLIAAVLGSKKRCGAFFERFWWHKPQASKPPSPDDFVSFKMALEAEARSGPSWPEARARFLKALSHAEQAIAARQRDAEEVEQLDMATCTAQRLAAETAQATELIARTTAAVEEVEAELAEAQAGLRSADERLRVRRALAETERVLDQLAADCPTRSRIELQDALRIAREQMAAAEAQRMSAQRRLDIVRASRPGFFQRLLKPGSVTEWRDLCLSEAATLDRWEKKLGTLKAQAEGAQADLNRWDARESARKARGDAMHAANALLGSDLPPLSALKGDARSAQAQVARKQADREARSAQLKRAEARFTTLQASLVQANERIRRCSDALDRAGIDDAKRSRWLLSAMPDEERQQAAPWHDEQLTRVRHELFVAAMEFHKAFIVANRRMFLSNLGHFVDLMAGKLSPNDVAGGIAPLWESFFLVVPVVSTTFASFGRLFRAMDRESLGWLLIDEAGQAPPQAALGAIWRAKRTVVVGDPLQIEPIVQLPKAAIEALRVRAGIERRWDPTLDSAQSLADRANPFGTFMGETWVGSPLRVHRRCQNPMFAIANRIAYDDLMVYGTESDDQGKEWLGESCWIHVPARSADGHWIPAQGELAVGLVEQIVTKEGIGTNGKLNLFLISPFRKVAYRARDELRLLRGVGPTAKEMAGTIHTFQGKEADAVILLLGGDPEKPGSISSFAAAKPNLLNVAVTRARRRIYVVGDVEQWSRHPFFSTMAEMLPIKQPAEFLVSGPASRP